mgnify:CR=1 FL=1
MRLGYNPHCPYCSGDLSMYSNKINLWAVTMACPYCARKIYGTKDETGAADFIKYNPNKLLLISIIGFIIFMLIIFVLFAR